MESDRGGRIRRMVHRHGVPASWGQKGEKGGRSAHNKHSATGASSHEPCLSSISFGSSRSIRGNSVRNGNRRMNHAVPPQR
nr:hypothetical protein CFP56_04483 [Quercus suber]